MLTHVTQCGFHYLLSRLMTQQNIHKFSHVNFKCSEVVIAIWTKWTNITKNAPIHVPEHTVCLGINDGIANDHQVKGCTHCKEFQAVPTGMAYTFQNDS